MTTPTPDALSEAAALARKHWGSVYGSRITLFADNLAALIDEVRQAATAQAVPQWLPIESAPKDGAVILVWRFYPCAVQWFEGEVWNWRAIPIGEAHLPFEENAFLADDPAITHWMPLPSAPPVGIKPEGGEHG